MRSRLKFKSRRAIITASIIAVLAVGAGLGGYFYAKGNNQAGAASVQEGSTQTATEQPSTPTPSTDNNQPNTPGTNPNAGDNNNDGANNGNGANAGDATNGDNNGNANGNAGDGAAANDGAAGNNAANGNANGGNANAGNAGGAGANAGNAGAANAGDNTDATTVIDNITVEDPWESHAVRWTPETLNVSTAEVNVDYTGIKTEITATKVWEDGSNKVGSRPESIKLNLYAGEELIDSVTLNANDMSGDTWTANFGELSVYDENGKRITYTVKEDGESDGILIGNDNAKYAVKYDGLMVTNTVDYTSIKTEVLVEKKWENIDSDAAKAHTVSGIVVSLSGVKETKTLNKDNEWKDTFKDLQKYDAEGNIITYTATEEGLTDADKETLAKYYTSNIAGGTITNTFDLTKVDDTIDYPVEKKWENVDSDAAKAHTVSGIVVSLSGVKETKTLNKDNEWKDTFKDLPKYDAEGKTITYTATEEGLTDADKETLAKYYTSNIVGGKITNTFDLTKVDDTTEVSGEKTWIGDEKYKDKTRPESITINLIADGNPALDDNGKAITATVKEGTDKKWKYSFTGLDKYKDGNIIKYTITENKLQNYDTDINKYNVTNTLKTTEVSVHKNWEDAENDIKNHPKIKINLYQNVDEITEETEPYDFVLLENGKIDYTFRDLPKVDAQGNEYSYTIAEEDVIGYKSSMTGNATTGYTITNTLETTTATVIKVWDDEDDLDEVRPDNITVQLKADGANFGSATELSKDTEGLLVQKIDGKETWIYTFRDLPKVNASNKNYEYTAVETKIGDDRVSNNKTDDYTVSIADDGLNTTTITNTHTIERISIDVSKEWVDGDRSHKSDTITVKLLADGKDANKTVTLSDDNNWKDSFTRLRKYINGKEVAYTVEEANVPSGYTSKITGSPSKGYKITNTLNKPRSVTLTKHYTETSQTEVKVPIDVVFILDTSTSMRTIQEGSHSRAYNMVEAVNATINELKKSNSQNRISIVGYSDTASVIMPLKEASKVSKNPLSYSSYTISCSGGTPRSVDGGTYTQSGIALGTQQLIDVRDKTVEIQDQILTRVPVIILLSDGMPTYYTTDYDDVNATSTSGRSGNGYNETVEQGYYTIMSADYYKGEVTKEYRKTNKKITAKMYTVAVNVNSQYGLTVLNPITDNINNLKDSTGYISDEKYPNGKYYADRNFYKLLNGEKYQGLAKYYNSYYEIERDPKDLEDFDASRKNDDGYSYADFAYTNNVDKETLLANMKAAIDEATPKYITTQATQAEIDSYMVEIKDLDYSKDMTIKANGETYNKSDVITQKGGKYYLDLSKFPNNCDITVNYQSI